MRLLDARALIHEGIARLVDDADVDQPPYAILPHTWGEEEVLFEDIELGPNFEVPPVPSKEYCKARGYSIGSRQRRTRAQRSLNPQTPLKWPEKVCRDCWARSGYIKTSDVAHVKRGWNRVYNACLQACRDGLDYIWIDSCCINKDSSAELTEAINAMFTYYEESFLCYVYLEDCR